MAMRNPRGRANYEPNSWGADGGPRESVETGFASVPRPAAGPVRRVRAESFADHYSQARQFYISQTPVEQTHIGDALVFELSKVDTPAIRARMVSHLRHIDEDLASYVTKGLRLGELPEPAAVAQQPRTDLPESPALSILRNGPDSFAGRKVGVLLTDGADAGLFSALQQALSDEGAIFEIVAPEVGGVTDSDGSDIVADQKIDGGPSVLYDAVVLLPSKDDADLLAGDATARDFVTDAFAHAKFIGYADTAMPLLEKAGIAADLDEGCIQFNGAGSPAAFVEQCRQLRYWPREHAVDQT